MLELCDTYCHVSRLGMDAPASLAAVLSSGQIGSIEKDRPKPPVPHLRLAVRGRRSVSLERKLGLENDYRAGRFPAITPGRVPSVHQSGLLAIASVDAGPASAICGTSSTEAGMADATNPRRRLTERSLSGMSPVNTCVLIILAPHLLRSGLRRANLTSPQRYSASVCGHKSRSGSVAADPILSECNPTDSYDGEGSFRAKSGRSLSVGNCLNQLYL
jgi:hypothetical protein